MPPDNVPLSNHSGSSHTGQREFERPVKGLVENIHYIFDLGLWCPLTLRQAPGRWGVSCADWKGCEVLIRVDGRELMNHSTSAPISITYKAKSNPDWAFCNATNPASPIPPKSPWSSPPSVWWHSTTTPPKLCSQNWTIYTTQPSDLTLEPSTALTTDPSTSSLVYHPSQADNTFTGSPSFTKPLLVKPHSNLSKLLSFSHSSYLQPLLY